MNNATENAVSRQAKFLDDEHSMLSHSAFKAGMKFLAESLGLIDSEGNTEIPENQIASYQIILRDLSDDAFRWAVYSLSASHRFPKLPTAGEIRAAAVEFMLGPIVDKTAAWNEALALHQRYERLFDTYFGKWKGDKEREAWEKIRAEADPELIAIIDLIKWGELKNQKTLFNEKWEQSRERKRERLMKPPGYSQAQLKLEHGRNLEHGEAKTA